MPAVAAVIVVLTVLLMAWTVYLVARARGRYGIKAPATSGHPGFDCAFRAQMNTLESVVMFLPTFWLATQYGNGELAAAFGALWLLGRVLYVAGYVRAPEKRSLGFGIAALGFAGLLVQALWGVGAALV